MWSSVRKVHDIDVSQRRKCEPLPVRRLCWLLDQPEFHWTLVHTHGTIQIGTLISRHFCCERNDLVLACAYRDPVDLASPCCHYILAVGGEGIIWHEIARKKRFLIVTLHRIFEPVFFAVLEISDTKSGFRLISCCVNQEISVPRNDRTHGTSGSIGHRILIAGDQVAPGDLRKWELDVIKPLRTLRVLPCRVIEIMPIARRRRPKGTRPFSRTLIRFLVRLGDLHAGASTDVVHP